MSFTERRNWLVAYDIADPHRLARVHRFLKKYAVPAQYSVFIFRGNQLALDRVLRGIEERIADDEDDVRAYYLPDRCEVSMLGLQYLPEGIALGVHTLERLLRRIEPDMNIEGGQ